MHDPYYSNQDPAQSVSVGESILDAYADVDVIICNDSTALPGQCKAAENKGLTAKDITITGFCTPSGMTSYLENGICTRWGLWDCGIQGAMGCYLAAYISAGNTVKVGDKIDIPSIGTVEVLANDALVARSGDCCGEQRRRAAAGARCLHGGERGGLQLLIPNMASPRRNPSGLLPLWWRLRHDAAVRLC